MNTSAKCFYSILIAALSCSSFSQVPQPFSGEQRGTCAIIAVSEANIAFAIDSKITREDGTDSCKQTYIDCKGLLVRRDLLIAVTGIFSDGNWSATNEIKKLVAALPENLTESNLDDFAKKWVYTVGLHYDHQKASRLPSDREVSTLIVATRIQGRPYILKVPITYNQDKGAFESWTMNPQFYDYPSLHYAGSCRDKVNTNQNGSFIRAVDPLSSNLQVELDRIASERNSSTSAEDLGRILVKMEDVFSRAGREKKQCWVGPPYYSAIWSKGGDHWSVQSQATCGAHK